MTQKNKRKYLFIGAIAIGAFLIAFRLYLPVLARDFANKELNKDPLYHGSIERVQIHLWRGAYTAIGLKIETVQGQKLYPFLSASKIDVGIGWKELFHGSIVARVEGDQFRVNIVRESANGKTEEKKVVTLGGPTQGEKKKEVKTWQSSVNALIPLKIARLNLTQGEIHFRDLTSTPRVDIFLDNVTLNANNLTNSTHVSKSLFGTIDVKARAMKSGDLKMHVYLNPLKSPPELKLDTELRGLDLVDLNDFFKSYGKFDVKNGKISIYSELATGDNKVEGYFKPIIKQLKVTNFKKDRKLGIGHAIWEQIVGTVGAILKNHPEDQQAAKIPFSGKLTGPDFDIWETALSILKNVFIQPMAPALDNSVKLSDVKKEKHLRSP